MAKISVTITITKDSVYEDVAKVTAYFGAKKAPDGASYEQIAITDTQYEMLDSFWRIGTNALTDVFKPYINSVPVESDSSASYSTTLYMPSNWNSHLKNDVVLTAKSYLVQFIAGMWFRMATDQNDAQNEDKHSSDAIALIGQLRRKIYDRVRPVKPTYTTDSDSSDDEDDDSTESSSEETTA